jgi:cytochrome c-type biogenesis protein CcmE
MARRASPARLVIALGIAAMLAVFLVYTALAGGTPQLRPSQLKGRTGEVSLVGKVVGEVSGDARGSGLRFQLRDVEGTASVPVVYRGSVPELFRSGRDISLRGELRNGTFVGEPGTLVTKCPSKYTPETKDT